MRKFLHLSLVLLTAWTVAGTLQAQTAARGVFSVSATKTVQFATANETYTETNNLTQWSTAASHATPDANGWYVLNHEEWTYLLVTRDEYKNALGNIDGQNGLIILPDEWSQPAGVPDFKTIDDGFYFDNNTYSSAEWALMEAAGALFLPSDGYGYGSTPTYENQGSHGAYWSSDQLNGSNGYCMRFNDGDIHDQNNADKTNYYSIRLVREVTVTELDENDDPSTFATKLDAANDFDFAIVRRTLYKDGYFNTICLPFNVANIETTDLAGADVYEFVSGEVADGLLQVNIEKVTTGAMEKGVPYLIRWDDMGEEPLTYLTFNGLTASDWDDATAESVTNNNVTYQGFYGKTHITDDGTNHYNFFLGENNELLWPEDGNDGTAKMSGFRAYFYITPGGGPNPAPMYRGMPAALRIRQTATEIEQAQWGTQQAAKVLHDGQVVLIINGETYTMKGQRL